MYDTLIKRINKAIETAQMKDHPVAVHKVTVDDDITGLTGLVVVLHPSYTESKNAKIK